MSIVQIVQHRNVIELINNLEKKQLLLLKKTLKKLVFVFVGEKKKGKIRIPSRIMHASFQNVFFFSSGYK